VGRSSLFIFLSVAPNECAHAARHLDQLSDHQLSFAPRVNLIDPKKDYCRVDVGTVLCAFFLSFNFIGVVIIFTFI
jgi:hypothetical protein